jgi:hypothetical protein
MENRRRFPRFQVQLAIAYYPQDKATQFSYTVSKNVSRSGICIPANSSIAKNSSILEMEIEIAEKQCVPVTGKVKWVKMLNHKAPLGEELPIEFANDEEVGIEFVDVKPADIDRLIDTQGSSRKPTFFGS